MGKNRKSTLFLTVRATGKYSGKICLRPDAYGFGDAAFWMGLHEDMRQAGFFMKTVENSCENFAVIDQEIVWYGNIHLLGKEKIEDNIMRVKDKKIADELLELAFK